MGECSSNTILRIVYKNKDYKTYQRSEVRGQKLVTLTNSI